MVAGILFIFVSVGVGSYMLHKEAETFDGE